MTEPAKIERALMLSTRSIDSEVMHVEARPVLVIGGDIRNPNGDAFVRESGERELADLVISCQLERDLNDEDAPTRPPYGFKVEYREVYSAGLERVEAMVKQLRKLDRELDRMNHEWGYAETFSAYLARVAKALKVDHYLWRRDGSGHLYSDNAYTHADTPSMQAWVQRTIDEWQSEKVPA